MELKDFLAEKKVDEKIKEIILQLSEACFEIKSKILEGDVSTMQSKNVYGEMQSAMDIAANKIIYSHLKENKNISVFSSEEEPDEIKISDGNYAVAVDPLDGSSLMDVNLSIGTIASIYRRKTFLGSSGEEILSALYVVYGPRTTMTISCGDEIALFELSSKTWFLKKDKIILKEEGKLFSPGNLNAAKENGGFKDLVDYWINNDYKLRYSGGMVPDLNQIFLKGKGIFVYPASSSYPDGKLRLLFECRPMAYLAEKAGGSADNGRGRVLLVNLKSIAQRSQIFVGSKNEVSRAVDYLKS